MNAILIRYTRNVKYKRACGIRRGRRSHARGGSRRNLISRDLFFIRGGPASFSLRVVAPFSRGAAEGPIVIFIDWIPRERNSQPTLSFSLSDTARDYSRQAKHFPYQITNFALIIRFLSCLVFLVLWKLPLQIVRMKKTASDTKILGNEIHSVMKLRDLFCCADFEIKFHIWNFQVSWLNFQREDF